MKLRVKEEQDEDETLDFSIYEQDDEIGGPYKAEIYLQVEDDDGDCADLLKISRDGTLVLFNSYKVQGLQYDAKGYIKVVKE